MTQKLKSTNFTQLTWELQKMFGLNTWTAQRLAHAHCHKLRDGILSDTTKAQLKLPHLRAHL